jgi:hypothetical protein
MGKLMAGGGAVPLSALQGVTPSQAEDLKAKGITDIDGLAALSIDDLVDYLDISLDEAQRILGSAQSVVAARNDSGETSETGDDAENTGDTNSEETNTEETAETEDENSPEA